MRHLPFGTLVLIRLLMEALRRERPAFSRWLVVCALTCLSSITAYTQTATVAHATNLRPQGSTENHPIVLLEAGTEVQLIDPSPTADGWYHVMTSDGQEGWVWGANIEIAALPKPEHTSVTTVIVVVLAVLAVSLLIVKRGSRKPHDDPIIVVMRSTGGNPGVDRGLRANAPVANSDDQMTLPGTSAPEADSRPSIWPDPEVERLVKELVHIGFRPQPDSGAAWYLTRAKGRAIEIGAILNARGGMQLMLQAHSAVCAALGGVAGRELEVAWNGIGEWQG